MSYSIHSNSFIHSCIAQELQKSGHFGSTQIQISEILAVDLEALILWQAHFKVFRKWSGGVFLSTSPIDKDLKAFRICCHAAGVHAQSFQLLQGLPSLHTVTVTWHIKATVKSRKIQLKYTEILENPNENPNEELQLCSEVHHEELVHVRPMTVPGAPACVSKHFNVSKRFEFHNA